MAHKRGAEEGRGCLGPQSTPCPHHCLLCGREAETPESRGDAANDRTLPCESRAPSKEVASALTTGFGYGFFFLPGQSCYHSGQGSGHAGEASSAGRDATAACRASGRVSQESSVSPGSSDGPTAAKTHRGGGGASFMSRYRAGH